jgi:hypothetical protein
MTVTGYCSSATRSAVAAYFTADPSRTRSPFFCEITLHPQDSVVFAEPFQLDTFGLGQILVLDPAIVFRFLHPFA